MSNQRQPVEYADRMRNVMAVLSRLQLSQQQLQSAMANFPPNFDRAAFVAAWNSDDPAARNDAQSVRSNADDIRNTVMLLLNTSGRTARSMDLLMQRPDETMLDALQREGRLTRTECDALDLARSVRDRSQHHYFQLDPAEVHDMVAVQVASLPRLIHRIAQWIGRWPAPEQG